MIVHIPIRWPFLSGVTKWNEKIKSLVPRYDRALQRPLIIGQKNQDGRNMYAGYFWNRGSSFVLDVAQLSGHTSNPGMDNLRAYVKVDLGHSTKVNEDALRIENKKEIRKDDQIKAYAQDGSLIVSKRVFFAIPSVSTLKKVLDQSEVILKRLGKSA